MLSTLRYYHNCSLTRCELELLEILMTVAGVAMLVVRFGYIRLKFAEKWEDEYQIAEQSEEAKSA